MGAGAGNRPGYPSDGRFKSVEPRVGSAAVAVIVCRHMRELIPAVDREALRAAVVAGQPGRYLASFENRFGEPLVFVHDDGERDATVFLGDVDWQPCRVSDAGGRPQVADLILNDEERAFLDACWQATVWRRARADRARA